MRVTVDLAAFVGAEYMSKDNVPGIFIPLVPNVAYKVGPGGRHAFAHFQLWPNRSAKSFDYDGTQRIPKEHADRYLESPEYAGKRPKCAWVWSDGTPPGGLVTKEDFDKIVGGK